MTNQKETTEQHLRRALTDAMSEISKRDHTIALLNAKINELHAVSAAEDRTTILVRKLYNKIDNKIMNHINTHGTRKKIDIKVHPKITLDEALPLNKLHAIAIGYDIDEFFTYHSKKQAHPLKLHYRVGAKIYRSGRDGSFAMIRRTLGKVKG
ncbi:hypothetical protein IPL85_01860 [Candidatus Saccharibacteria bacterium]|nr:MAG: hypothetical protein IPL85_01860 [Candidatus Saccharibacteria bacterium]